MHFALFSRHYFRDKKSSLSKREEHKSVMHKFVKMRIGYCEIRKLRKSSHLHAAFGADLQHHAAPLAEYAFHLRAVRLQKVIRHKCLNRSGKTAAVHAPRALSFEDMRTQCECERHRLIGRLPGCHLWGRTESDTTGET